MFKQNEYIIRILSIIIKESDLMFKKYKSYIISVLIALAVGGLSAFLTRNNMNIYSETNMPSFSPPPLVFAIVWPILYILMGISSGGVYDALSDNPTERLNLLTI